jgi:ABC-type branched-subunit amino acid transport system ATPase component
MKNSRSLFVNWTRPRTLAVDDVSFELQVGEIVGLIGPNGAGKTTLVNLITGVHRLVTGEIWYGGERIDRLPPDRIARRGIARTFQVVQPFPHMTVLENVTGGALFAGGAPTIQRPSHGYVARFGKFEHAFVGRRPANIQYGPPAQAVSSPLSEEGRKR